MSRILFKLVALSGVILFSGCSVAPPAEAGPSATIRQQTVVDYEKKNCFMVLGIDGKDYSLAGASRLKETFQLPARPARLRLRAHVIYFAEIRNIVPPPHADGWVDVQLLPGHQYQVKGITTAAGSRVWLQDVSTGEIVSREVTRNEIP